MIIVKIFNTSYVFYANISRKNVCKFTTLGDRKATLIVKTTVLQGFLIINFAVFRFINTFAVC